MMKFFLASLCLLAFANGFPESRDSVPTFDYQVLYNQLNGLNSQEDGKLLDEVARVSKNLGSFVITNLPDSDNYQNAINNLQKEARACFTSTSTKVISLNVAPDVIRMTSATSSLNPSEHQPNCIRSSTDVIENSLNNVGEVIHMLIAKIAGEKAFYKVKGVNNLIPLSDSGNLDHVHLYSTESDSKNAKPAAPLHTDNGLFLLTTPSQESPLHVQDRNGKMLTTVTAEPGVVVLFGRALDQWLLGSSSLFRPAPHSVPPMRSNKDRVIFARMFVAPKEAVPVSGKSIKFEDFFIGHDDNSKSDLCPSAHTQVFKPKSSEILWRKARQAGCEEGTQFCWMSCLPIDTQCPAQGQSCYSSSHQPCCKENETPEDHGCLDMDVSCQWHCNSA